MSILKNFLRGQSRRNLQELQALEDDGVTGWADTVTHLYSAAPQSNAGFGVTVSPTT